MGQFIVWHYRTTIFAQLADHTYVTCGNLGKSWNCWGGDSGGTVLREGTGSTAQADAIATPDERAGITCYLINGVCHQAANRILYPAGITVRGARGYALSEALFGPYGRPRALFGLCKAPFYKHDDVSGDIPECASQLSSFSSLEKKTLKVAGNDQDESYQKYLKIVGEKYDQAVTEVQTKTFAREDTRGFQVQLFDLMTEFKLGDSGARKNLLEIRETTENRRLEIETNFENRGLSVERFVQESNKLDEKFQENIANSLSDGEYQKLFELERGDVIVLGDLEIARKYYSNMSPDETS